MAKKYGMSEPEYNLILLQQSRRLQYRNEFLKQRTNPFKHASEAGIVFEPAIQRFISLKACQAEYFQPNVKNGLFGIGVIILPMLTYGYAVWLHRSNKEEKIRNGELRYRDRIFKYI